MQSGNAQVKFTAVSTKVGVHAADVQKKNFELPDGE